MVVNQPERLIESAEFSSFPKMQVGAETEARHVLPGLLVMKFPP